MLFRRKRSSATEIPTSSGYQIINQAEARRLDLRGWLTPQVAERQHAAYQELVQGAQKRRPRRDLELAAQMVERTGLVNASFLEVGCGSGYYSEIFSCLLKRPPEYAGIDFSAAMISLAKSTYPSSRFVMADASKLPFAEAAFDIVFNGVSLMHIARYEEAIAETARVARRWCIFHTLPTLKRRATTFLTKRAYGELVVEIIFSEQELFELFSSNGMTVTSVEDSIPYDLQDLLGERTDSRTFLCRVDRAPE